MFILRVLIKIWVACRSIDIAKNKAKYNKENKSEAI